MQHGRIVNLAALAAWMVLLAASTPLLGQQGPAAVRAERVRVEEVQEQRRVTGELQALRRAEVATQEPGLIVELPVREGQRVEAGQMLARLDARRLEVRKRELESDELVAEALVAERKASHDRAARDLELYRSSYERGAANRKELLDAEAAALVAEAKLQQARRQKEVIAARLELLEERLADMTIAAPFDGVVVGRHAELGEWVGEGDAVVDLVSTGVIEAWFDVPQRLFGALAERTAPITVAFEAVAETVQAGDLRVIPLVDPRARTFSLVARLDDQGRLTPGMSATAWVPTGSSARRTTVPTDAILRNDAGAYLYVARGGGEQGPAQAVPVQVSVLFPAGGRAVIEAPGVGPGDLVVVEGNERLFPMMPIRPIVEGATGAPAAGGGEEASAPEPQS